MGHPSSFYHQCYPSRGDHVVQKNIFQKNLKSKVGNQEAGEPIYPQMHFKFPESGDCIFGYRKLVGVI